MDIGTEVLYCPRHHDWLVNAGVWERTYGRRGRKEVTGTVIDVSPGLLLVAWPDGMRWHLPDNLEAR